MHLPRAADPQKPLAASLLPSRRGVVLSLAMAATVAGLLLAMGRVPICACGHVALWTGQVNGPENSQQIADWYSPSHVIHGLLFYFFAHLLWRRWKVFGGRPAVWALPIAIGFEGFWELLENSPLIIERYRSVTVNYGYSGDSVLNSVSDLACMTLGFLLASRLPVWTSVVLALGFELLTAWIIHDNLTLNVIMLVWPIQAIRDWQGMV